MKSLFGTLMTPMNTTKILVMLICMGLLGLQACYPNTSTTAFNQASTPTNSATLKIPTSSPTSIIATTPPQNNCVRGIEQYPKSPISQGKIVLSGYLNFSGAPIDAPSYLLDVKSGEKIMLPQEAGKIIIPTSYSISPNREWLAYTQVTLDATPDETLHFVDTNGIERNAIATHISQWGTLWVDDTRLLIESLKENDSVAGPRAEVLLINSLTGGKKELPNDFPNQWNGDNLDWGFNLSRVIYNPSLTKVVYPTFVEPNSVMRLIDVQTGKILLDVPTTDLGKYPAWSPDGKQLAFATQTNKGADQDSYRDEIFTLTENGKLVQLTHLSDTYNYSYVTALAWSTDSRQIAFLVNNTNWEKSYTGVHLAVIDVLTGELHEYCDIGVSSEQPYVPDSGNLTWSPDNKYVLFNLIDPNNDRHTIVVIAEVSTGNMFLIGENYRGVGWLK